MRNRNIFHVDEHQSKLQDWLMVLLVIVVLVTPVFLLSD